MRFCSRLPTWFSIKFFGLAPLVSDLSIYLREFLRFPAWLPYGAGSLLDRLQSALVKPRVPRFPDRPIYVWRGWAFPFSTPDVFTSSPVFLRIFRLHTSCSDSCSVLHVLHAIPRHAYASYEVVDLSPSPHRRWLTSCGSFRGPSCLKGVFFAPPSPPRSRFCWVSRCFGLSS